MNDNNPFSPPVARVDDVGSPAAGDPQRLDRIASGQRWMVISVVVMLASLPLQGALGAIAGLISVASAGLGIFSVIRLTGGLGTHIVARVIYVLMILFPFLNLLAMARLSGQATKALRAAGLRVGLLGASKPKP
jgi:hypothetical protein